MCEHEVWIDPIQLETAAINAIFICVPEMKQLAIKIENEYGFVIRSARTDYPPIVWKTDLWSGRVSFKEDSPWQEFPACSDEFFQRIQFGIFILSMFSYRNVSKQTTR